MSALNYSCCRLQIPKYVKLVNYKNVKCLLLHVSFPKFVLLFPISHFVHSFSVFFLFLLKNLPTYFDYFYEVEFFII